MGADRFYQVVVRSILPYEIKTLTIRAAGKRVLLVCNDRIRRILHVRCRNGEPIVAMRYLTCISGRLAL